MDNLLTAFHKYAILRVQQMQFERAHDFTHNELDTLAALKVYGPLQIDAMQTATGQTQSTAYRTLKSLRTKGFVHSVKGRCGYFEVSL